MDQRGRLGADLAQPIRGALTPPAPPPHPGDRRRPLLVALAALLAAANLLYAFLWIHHIRNPPPARLGIEWDYAERESALVVTNVHEGSGARRAGVQKGDSVVGANGRRLSGPYVEPAVRGAPGDVVSLSVVRPPAREPREIAVTLDPAPAPAPLPPAQRLASALISVYDVPFIVVGLWVLFSRLHDRNAWLLALLFSTFAVGGPFLVIEGQIHPALRGFALAWKILCTGLMAAFFYYFFAVFPAPSALDRRTPWLKHVLLWGTAAAVVPASLWGLWAGGSAPLLRLAAATAPASSIAGATIAWIGFGLGVASLLSNARTPVPDVRRKTRVILWGALAAVLPGFLSTIVAAAFGREVYEMPFWYWAPVVLVLFLLPASIAYAVVVHRAMDIPVLLKRSARYVLVKRGFALLTLVAALGATVLLAVFSSRLFSPRTPMAAPAGMVVGAAFGALLVSAGSRVERRVASRIDRAFFRGAYDAQKILEDLAEQVRGATDARGVAALLEGQLGEALHPRTMAVYLEGADGALHLERGQVPPELQVLPPTLPVIREVARGAEPRELPPGAALGGLEALAPECLAPILGRSGELAGLLVLGERRSEEPYSGEDRRLLASVAGQAGMALENIRLAERMAERLEAERRAAHEMGIAQQIQSRLFPQVVPELHTLECAGGCRQARAVGGDYFDFLERGPGRLGLVLADVAGKGISAALLMATLQATLRSQQAAFPDPAELMRSINRVFHPSAAPNRFATVFFGEYDDASRRLRYVNCGHNAPALLRADGRVERLPATASVLGLFPDLECAVAEVAVDAGDLLLTFSDGASEAFSDAGEEFGEDRLIRAALAHRHEAVQEIVDSVAREVQAFSGREQEDDLTLLVVRGRS